MTRSRNLVIADAGAVVAVDLGTGNVRWRSERSDGGREDSGEVGLCITSNRVFAALWRGALECYDYESGALLWRAKTERGRGTVLVEQDVVVVAQGKTIYAFGATDGKGLWSVLLSGQFFNTRFGGRWALGMPGNVIQADTGSN